MSEVAARLQSQRRAWAHPGSSHDRLVRLLLIVLPIGIAVLGVGLVVAPLMTGAEVSFVLDKNKVDVASERLRVQSAEYRGEDAKGQAFKLNAGSAVQKSSTDAEVQLSDLNAQLGLPEGPATVRADKGRYNLQNDQVAIDGPIAFRTADGYTLDTHDATLDLKTRQLRSGGAVTGRTPTGTFSGDKLTADLEQRTVRVDGNARLRIYPKRANRQ
ncbi:LPS export ABC transporter periplasmic protein LptC [Sphingomonas sp. HF-S3]|uniref:LPS export ABC transporter periplasmic protein LptC n=1 Tax=Sphingomonas rustica TaxID=3103142 RepID=A0ABV0B1X5_9SPHN